MELINLINVVQLNNKENDSWIWKPDYSHVLSVKSDYHALPNGLVCVSPNGYDGLVFQSL